MELSGTYTALPNETIRQLASGQLLFEIHIFYTEALKQENGVIFHLS